MYYVYDNQGYYLARISEIGYRRADLQFTTIEPPNVEDGKILRFVSGQWHQEYQTELDDLHNHVQQRAAGYPNIGTQIDALWHAMDTGVLPMIPEFYNPIANVKERFPKPNVTSIVVGKVV